MNSATTVSERPGPGASTEQPASSPPKSHRRNRSNSSPAQPTSPPPSSEPKKAPQSDIPQVESKPQPAEENEEQKASTPSPASRKSDPKPIGRRNSWISNLSSKFSSGSTPPSQSSLKSSPASPKTTSPLDTHNPFGAAYSPKDKEEEKKDDSNPFTSTSPKGPSFIHNALRKFSSNSGGLPKLNPNDSICPRRVMNIDQNRHRCKVADLNQAKLNRVAFCVDVEIAGISHRDDDEEAPPTNQLRQPLPESNTHKSKKADLKSKGKEEAAALKHPETVLAEKDASPPAPAQATGDATTQSSSPPKIPRHPNHLPNLLQMAKGLIQQESKRRRNGRRQSGKNGRKESGGKQWQTAQYHCNWMPSMMRRNPKHHR